MKRKLIKIFKMKKRKIKTLSLEKTSIASLNTIFQLYGGTNQTEENCNGGGDPGTGTVTNNDSKKLGQCPKNPASNDLNDCPVITNSGAPNC